MRLPHLVTWNPSRSLKMFEAFLLVFAPPHGCFAYINGGSLGLVWKPEGRARVFLEESYAKESLRFTARKVMQGK